MGTSWTNTPWLGQINVPRWEHPRQEHSECMPLDRSILNVCRQISRWEHHNHLPQQFFMMITTIWCFVQATVRELDTAERRSSVSTLTINVIDVNDNAPFVASNQLSTSVAEGNYEGGAGQFLVGVSGKILWQFLLWLSALLREFTWAERGCRGREEREVMKVVKDLCTVREREHESALRKCKDLAQIGGGGYESFLVKI